MQASRLESLTGSCARMALLSALLLNLAILSQAQSATTPPPPAHSAVAAASATTQAHPTAHPAAEPRGNHEGIQVHGHWIIEVRNPDGKVVTHREFENNLEQPSGGQIIANILSGNSVPGEFAVLLPVSCVSGITFCVISSTGGDAVGAVTIPSDVSSVFGGAIAVFCSGPGTNAAACPQTLSVSALGGSVILTGGVVAVAAGSVGGVTTSQARCTNTNITLTGCLQQNGSVQPLTGTLISPAIPYGANQTVAVTVMISFSSGTPVTAP